MKSLLLTALLAAAPLVHGQITIVAWDTSGLSGSTATLGSTSNATNVTGGTLQRGAGLGAASSTGTFSSNGFSNSDSDDYVEFSFTVDSGFLVSLADFTITTATSNTGPGTLGLYSSNDSFVSSLYTFNQSGTSSINHTIDLSSFTSVTGTMTFRIVEIGDTQADGVGSTATSGAFRVSELDITGTVSAVPEPSGYAAFFGLAALGFVATRRHR